MKNNLELPANFLIFLTNGSVKMTCDGDPSVNFKSQKNVRIIDVIDVPVKITKNFGFIKKLSQAKNLAKKLKKENLTLEVRYKGNPVLKLGKEANPKLAKIVTLSKDIEITDLKKLNQLSKVI